MVFFVKSIDIYKTKKLKISHLTTSLLTLCQNAFCHAHKPVTLNFEKCFDFSSLYCLSYQFLTVYQNHAHTFENGLIWYFFIFFFSLVNFYLFLPKKIGHSHSNDQKRPLTHFWKIYWDFFILLYVFPISIGMIQIFGHAWNSQPTFSKICIYRSIFQK